MCAGYELAVDPEAIGRAFRVKDVQFDLPGLVPPAQSLPLFDEPAREPVLERFPRQLGLIVVARPDPERPAEPLQRRIGPARFGLVPHFARSLADGDKLYNARSESVQERPTFRAAFARRRCLVPVSAFYEWSRRSGKAQRHAFRAKDGGLLALAGIWEIWRSPDGQKVTSFAILTTSPNTVVASIHTRMPVVLPFAAHDMWLSGETSQEVLSALLVPAPDPLLVALPG